MNSDADNETLFLRWALTEMGFRWEGFRKPQRQVLKRIRGRIYELNLPGGFKEYMEYLRENPEEWNQLERLCYVTISRFFRDRKLWDYIRDSLIPELIQDNPGTLKAWSAGCCNGEEPYTVSIICNQLEKKIAPFPVFTVLATDHHREMLQRAREGIYPPGALKEMKWIEIQNFFETLENGQKRYKIAASAASNVEFEQRDIRLSLPEGPFGLVFCRNLVFTYFNESHQKRFLQRLKPVLSSGGVLIIGKNETVPETGWLERIKTVHPVYQKKSPDS